MWFWLVNVDPRSLNFVTFWKDMLALLKQWLCPDLWLWDVNANLIFSSFTFKPLISCQSVITYVFSQQINIAIDRRDLFAEMSKLVISMSLITLINLLKPTGHVIHHQFNIQQLYALPTLYLCVLYLSENEQWLVPLRV